MAEIRGEASTAGTAPTTAHQRVLSLPRRQERLIIPATQWGLLALALIVTRLPQLYRTSVWLPAVFVTYLLIALGLTLLQVWDHRQARRQWLHFACYAADIAFVSWMVYFAGNAGRDLFLLYGILALRVAVYYPVWPEAIVFPLSLGVVYTLVLRGTVGGWYFLGEMSFWLRYGLLFCFVGMAIFLGWVNERSLASEEELRRGLVARDLELDVKTRTTQQMAANLGNRVLQLRTLQEGIKAINSALELKDVLKLIVTNASQVLEGARCSVTLLDARGRGAVSMASADWSEGGESLDREVARRVVRDSRPLLVDGVPAAQELGLPGAALAESMMSVPLLVGDKAIGALSAVSSEPGAFSEEGLNLLGAFADQAAVAVSNARLYEQLVQEQHQTAQLYEHVEERRKELEAILRGIGDGVIVADPELNLLLMNPVAARMFGVRPDSASNLSLAELVPHTELLNLLREGLEDGQDAQVREIALAGEVASGRGRRRPLGKASRAGVREDERAIYQALASPILGGDGRVRGVVTVLRDITSQKELDRIKSNFLSVVSHELKTPLHSIKGFVDIILMGKTGPVNETQADFLGTVRDQTTSLQNLINDLLEFSRLDAGQVKLRLSDVSPEKVADTVIDKLSPMADQEGVEIELQVEGPISTIQADQMRIEQVLTNLVHNAIKFTPQGGKVTVRVYNLDAEVEVDVADTGIGIPGEALERVFDRFYQVDSSSTRHYRGTGLGLTISKHIVEYHRGRIWVESTEGEGSTFRVVLPIRLTGKDEELMLDFMSLPERKEDA